MKSIFKIIPRELGLSHISRQEKFLHQIMIYCCTNQYQVQYQGSLVENGLVSNFLKNILIIVVSALTVIYNVTFCGNS